jgi:hypothetical protein
VTVQNPDHRVRDHRAPADKMPMVVK